MRKSEKKIMPSESGLSDKKTDISIGGLQLEVVRVRAKDRFCEICKKYPELKAYLVFSSQFGQASLESQSRQILQDFPRMVVDSTSKMAVLEELLNLKRLEYQKDELKRALLGAKLERGSMEHYLRPQEDIDKATREVNRLVKKLKKQEKDIEKVNDKIEEQAATFQFHPDVNVELRFKKLKFKMVGQLQCDALVDRELTLQTRASIRIVLGSLRLFAQEG